MKALLMFMRLGNQPARKTATRAAVHSAPYPHLGAGILPKMPTVSIGCGWAAGSAARGGKKCPAGSCRPWRLRRLGRPGGFPAMPRGRQARHPCILRAGLPVRSVASAGARPRRGYKRQGARAGMRSRGMFKHTTQIRRRVSSGSRAIATSDIRGSPLPSRGSPRDS
jgi:hypothetical protein